MSITLNNQNIYDSPEFAYQLKREIICERLENLGFTEYQTESFNDWLSGREVNYNANNLETILDVDLINFANGILEFTSNNPNIPIIPSYALNHNNATIPDIPSFTMSNIPRDLDTKPFHPINFNPNVYYVDPNETDSEEDDDESEQVEEVYQESDAEADFERNCLNLRFRGRYRRAFIPSNNLPSQ